MYTKSISYDRTTCDYAYSCDGELIGYAGSYHEAEIALDQHVFNLLTHAATAEVEYQNIRCEPYMAELETPAAPEIVWLGECSCCGGVLADSDIDYTCHECVEISRAFDATHRAHDAAQANAFDDYTSPSELANDSTACAACLETPDYCDTCYQIILKLDDEVCRQHHAALALVDTCAFDHGKDDDLARSFR